MKRETQIRIVNKVCLDALLQEFREWEIPETEYRAEEKDDPFTGWSFSVFTRNSNVIDVVTETLLREYYFIVNPAETQP